MWICVRPAFFFYVPHPFRRWSIIVHHNFLSFVMRNNFWRFTSWLPFIHTNFWSSLTTLFLPLFLPPASPPCFSCLYYFPSVLDSPHLLSPLCFLEILTIFSCLSQELIFRKRHLIRFVKASEHKSPVTLRHLSPPNHHIIPFAYYLISVLAIVFSYSIYPSRMKGGALLYKLVLILSELDENIFATSVCFYHSLQ